MSPAAPIAVVVHGINPTPGELDPLTRDLVARGYRTYQFHYDDDQGLRESAAQLEGAVLPLLAGSRRLVIVAHSMGGLVSRRALIEGGRLPALAARVRLVTVASPFGGFFGANFARLDFGIGPDSHDDLGTWSRFIRRPGKLAANVTHVKIETDERKQVRVLEGKRHKDDVLSRKHQRQKRVDQDVRWRHELVAGHVGAVRTDDGRVPGPLQRLLRMHLGPKRSPTPPESVFAQRLRRVIARLRALVRQVAAQGRTPRAGVAQGLSATAR